MQKREIPETMQYNSSEKIPAEWISGRILKLFKIKNKLLLQLTENGKKRKACIAKGTADCYEECRKFLQPGDIICGSGEETFCKGQEREFQFSTVRVVKASCLDSVESGLAEGGKYALSKQKEYYHIYLAENENCALYVRTKARTALELRKFLTEKGYMECFTPILQKKFYGGGARPFVTHMADTGSDVYLRVTSELALRQYIAGGFDKIYEMGYYFRNGNTSAKYLTPFMAAEVYTAYSGEEQNEKFMEELFHSIVKGVRPLLESCGQCVPEAFLKKIPVCSFEDYFMEKTGISWEKSSEQEILRMLGKQQDCSSEELVKEIYKYLKQKLIAEQKDPLILTDLPAGVSPLIQKKTDKTLYRGYLIVNGATLMETAIGQEDVKGLEEQLRQQETGRTDYPDREMEKYRAFLHANALGYPRTASLFVSVDRFVSALCGIENIGDYQMKM